MRPAARSPLKQYPSVSTDIMSQAARVDPSLNPSWFACDAPADYRDATEAEKWPGWARGLFLLCGLLGVAALVIGLFSWVWGDWPL